MVNPLKKVLLIIALALMLVPVMGFQQILSLGFAAAPTETKIEEQDALISNSGTGPSPEAGKQLEDMQSKEEEDEELAEDKQLTDNEVIKVQNLDLQTDFQDGKTAYLTFDDGPSPLVTPKILEILRKYDIKATFFVIGKMAEQNPELVRQIWEEGHSICNHTYSHNYKQIYSSPDNFMDDVAKWEEALKAILGEDFSTPILRFPAGSFGKKRLVFRERVKEKGYVSIDWNALNGDAEALHVPADVLINRTKESTKNKNSAIVLMHDSNTKDTTAEALPEIINYLQSQGYTFKTLEGSDLQTSEVRP